MALITSLLIIYLCFGWVGLLYKKFFQTFIISVLLWLVFQPAAHWLNINQELLFLFAVGIGSMTYLIKFGFHHVTPFLLFVGTIGYYCFTMGFLKTFYLFLLSSVGSIVVQLPLRVLPTTYNRITEREQMISAYLFTILSFGNIIILYFLYGI